MTPKRGFDGSCLDLAEYFLQDSVVPAGKVGEFAQLLAQHIQDAIEDWLRENVDV